MLWFPGPSGRDHRCRDRADDRAHQRQVVARAGPIPVHRREQELTGSAIDRLARPCDGLAVGAMPPAMRVHRVAVPVTARVDGNHDALFTEARGRIADQTRTLERRSVERHLVRSGSQQRIDVAEPADAAAYGDGDEHLIRRAAHRVEQDGARVTRRSDVEEDELVCSVLVVPSGQLRGISRIAQVDEVDSLDHASRVDVQARNDPPRQGHETGTGNSRSSSPRSRFPS